MKAAIVELSYRQEINAMMQTAFEQAVLKASYSEFMLKSQNYNPEGKFKTFKEMVAADGRANSLHYKCAFPIGPYIELLNNEIPILHDNAGRSISFKSYQFQLIDSDINNHLAHQVSITYITKELTLLDNAGDYLLLSHKLPGTEYSGGPHTFFLKIVPGLSIDNYKILTHEPIL